MHGYRTHLDLERAQKARGVQEEGSFASTLGQCASGYAGFACLHSPPEPLSRLVLVPPPPSPGSSKTF